MREKLTIVIPTHNRHLILERAISYYSLWDCEIIICDSSPVIKSLFNNKNFNHIHYADVNFSKKIYNVLKTVTTPFVCLCADDDFLALNGIIEGIDFLEKNNQYVSVQGRYLQFWFSSKSILSAPLYPQVDGLDLCQEDPKERIIASATSGMHQIYSLHRTNVLMDVFSVCQDVAILSFAEYTSNLVGLFYGKHKILPMFWMARDAARYTIYNYNQSNVNTLVGSQQLILFLQSEDGLKYKEVFSQLYSKITKRSSIEGIELFSKIFLEIYLLLGKDKSKQSVLQIILKLLKSYFKVLIPQKILGWRYRKIYAFPFVEKPSYISDWETIIKVINEFEDLPTVANRFN